MAVGALLSSGFQLLGDQFPVGHPAGVVAANLSGVTIGSLIMVLGFLRDSRVEEERKRTAAAEARAERERGRADRIIERYQAATEALIKRLEELNGNSRSKPDLSK